MSHPSLDANSKLRVAGVCVLIIGCVCLLTAGLFYASHRQFLATATRASGQIRGFDQRLQKDNIYYTAIVTFSDSAGISHSVKSNSSSTTRPGKIGDRIDVLYTPGKPENAVFDGFASLWLLPTIFAINGVLEGLAGLTLIFWPHLRAMCRPSSSLDASKPSFT